MDYEKERECVSSQEREMPTNESKFGRNLHGLAERDILVEMEHEKAHRTEK